MKLDVIYCRICCCNHPPGDHNTKRLKASMDGKPPPPKSWEGETPAEGAIHKVARGVAKPAPKAKPGTKKSTTAKGKPRVRAPKGAGRQRPEGYQRDLMRIVRDAKREGISLKKYRKKYGITGAKLPKHLKDEKQ